MLVGTQFRCESDKRRDAVIASASMNGIDYLEVVDDWAKTSPDSPRQRTLLVHLFKKPAVSLDKSNVTISGGARIAVDIEWAYVYGTFPAGTLFPDEQAMLDALPDRDRVLVVRTTSSGDYSTYRLSLVASPVDSRPPPTFDKKLSAVDLSFKVECPTEFDCATPQVCPPLAVSEPEIDYLAKDWSSFRRLMLDRLTATMPEWRERNTADVGVLLVELLAYAADHLSYFQDAVATEAYLGTARTRVSVRRHARMLDYPIFDGANARTWVAVTWEGAAPITLPAHTRFATRTPELSTVARAPGDATKLTAAGSVVFESMADVLLDKGLNQVALYTWGDEKCCLAKGATQATLDNSGNRLANLQKGMVLVLGEVLSPDTALPEDANAAHRQAVRITSVDLTATDPLFKEADGVTPQRLAEITWHEDDALQFPLCLYRIAPIAEDHPKGRVALSATARVPIVIRVDAIDPTTKQATSISWSSRGGLAGTYTTKPVVAGTYTDAETGLVATFTPELEVGETFSFGPASVAWGNIAPVDHGATVTEKLAVVPGTGTYRPRLAQGPVTQAAAYDGEQSASKTTLVERGAVAPIVHVTFPQEPGVTWEVAPDLLESDLFDPKFVVESEDDGTATLRFGDGVLGRLPEASPLDSFGNPEPPTVHYRVGNGTAGNVGAEAIAHVAFDPPAGTAFDQISLVRNPLAATGGAEPESIEQVKLYAPQAFRVQERAVNVDDYAMIAERHPEVLKARATRRWTGSWYTIFLSVDRANGRPIDDAFEADLRSFLEKYRLAAQDIEVEPPQMVPLEIELAVCVDARYYRADVKRALLELFSNRDLPDGTRGFFHPDNFTFGQPVYLSAIIAKAMTVPGVVWVDPSPGQSVFRRFWDGADADLVRGRIDIARLEIARLDNDPNFPENGRIDFVMDGGM